MTTVRFGVIGLGMMGREFASAAARWCHLTDMDVKPEITALCGVPLTASITEWFTQNFLGISLITKDYRELIASSSVDAVYCAVPHYLHEELYTSVIESGKHLLGEKPFGIDKTANEAILTACTGHPNVFVRCSSEFPFFPAVQRICEMIASSEFGTIIEVEAGFLHSSDLDPKKPINWKRMAEFNGRYGCMGDLGMHVCHVPFRAGWIPRNVRALLSNIIAERPDGAGVMRPCDTWDNATLLCDALDPASGRTFPMTLKTQRIAPGEKNTWYLSILGTKASARFSTKNPKLLNLLRYSGGEQSWMSLEVGYEPAYNTITGGIFEFGFTDAILQMCAAYLYEMKHGKPKKPFAGCVTPEETALSHALFTAALESHQQKQVVSLS